jgi:competence protein ComFC
MNRIWIKQVFKIRQFFYLKQIFKFLSGLFWINEKQFEAFPETKLFLKENWIIGLYKYKDRAVKNAVWQMKYRTNRKVARFFGKKMAEIIIKNKLENYILVPIPIHWRRRMERGFNQSEWLCKDIIENFSQSKITSGHKIIFRKVLKRVIYSKKQSWNKRAARQKNIVSVFKVREKFKEEIAGKNILLIDDVVTTGATLKEARHELLIHDATSVKALTIAY